MELSLPKGMYDTLPEHQIRANRIITELTRVFELFGFEPLDTPSVELLEVLTSKHAGGEEILKEIYSFSDRGSRELALRYDLTVPFARVFGMYKPPLPFKRYQIGKVWRDGPTGRSRYREFTQCDVDVIGIDSMLVDAELLAIAGEVFRSLDIPVIIKVNNRHLLNGMVEESAIPADSATSAILALDKLGKINTEGVLAEMVEREIDLTSASRLLELASVEGSSEQILSALEAASRIPESLRGIEELRDLVWHAAQMGVTHLQVDPSLARGLAYYTGTIFEVMPTESTVTSSIAGGGRYDNMVSAFLQDGCSYPAAGISFGLSRILDVLSERETASFSTIRIFVIPFPGQLDEAVQLVSLLRSNGVNADFEKITQRRLRESMRYAGLKRIPYVVIVGPEEAAQGKFKLRDMTSGQESLLAVDELVTLSIDRFFG